MTTITAEMIKAAEVLVGVDYTAAGRAQMLDNLEGQIASAKARRGVALANSVPMALQCHPPDPRLMPDAKGASVAAGFWAMDAPSGRNLGFSAVFAANDSLALGALRYCRKYRLRMPQDVAIVGFDTIEFGATAVTPICAILQNVKRVCSLAIKRVVDLIGVVGALPALRLTEVGLDLVVRKIANQWFQAIG